MNDVVANPLASASVAARPSSTAGALVAVEQQRVMAEVQAQMLMARSNPRDPVAAMDRILNACTRPTLAEAAVYQYSRGGSDVTGPSIRLAEALAQSWGNIKTSVREMEQANGVSTVQTIAWDLETGYSSDKVFQVPHLRYTRQGSKRLEDPRDIYELVANNAARRLRACILAVIPGDVTEAAVAQCEATMKAKADTSPEGVRKILEAFAGYGVTKDQIEKRIQRRMDAIQPAQVVALKKIYASLRDGMSVPADWFEQAPEPAQGAGNASAAAVMRDRLNRKAEEQQPAASASPEIQDADRPDAGTDPFAPAAQPEEALQEAREGSEATDVPAAAKSQRQRAGKGPDGGVSYAYLAERLAKSTSRDAALLTMDQGRSLPPDQQKELQHLFDEKFANE